MAGSVLQQLRVSKNRWFAAGIAVFLVLVLVFTNNLYRDTHHGPTSYPDNESQARIVQQVKIHDLVKPEGLTVVLFVFFGRKDRVELLQCYIERNLVDHGGWVDEVHWVLNTKDEEDNKYLDQILTASPRYKKIDMTDGDVGGPESYERIWARVERGKLYVKIDDDVIWIADDAIPRMILTKLNNPEYLTVSANVVNSPLMGWVHYRFGALHPYLPEIDGSRLLRIFKLPHRTSWKYSDYPEWKGADDYVLDKDQGPPHEGHRWLRLKHNADIHRTPASGIEYATWGSGLKQWAIAAQEHYSFLENLENGNLGIYRMNKPWITDYNRLSVNLICIWADEVLDNLPIVGDDEEWLTNILPSKLKRSTAVEMNALAVHFTFGPQSGVESTDLLARYRDYTFQNACIQT